MRTAEDCMRRAALADAYAARVEFQIARQRLEEIARWWRSQAADALQAESGLGASGSWVTRSPHDVLPQ